MHTYLGLGPHGYLWVPAGGSPGTPKIVGADPPPPGGVEPGWAGTRTHFFDTPPPGSVSDSLVGRLKSQGGGFYLRGGSGFDFIVKIFLRACGANGV